MRLPDPLPIPEIRKRLELIFPEGTPDRAWFVRDMAAKVVFVMIYVGAVEGLERWLGPKHIYGMSDEQAEQLGEEERLAYGENAWKAGFKPSGIRWYADTTREPIRDETLRLGLAKVGAVVQRDVPTTSSKPRYALEAAFAALFSPSLQGEALREAILGWQRNHLDPLSLARIELLRQGAATLDSLVPVTLPNKTVRQLVTGPSASISKAVVEVFAPQFLYQPAVLLLSESGNKIVAQEEKLISSIGLKIDAAKVLPDIILFDLAPHRELLVFVEVVATDGPISNSRKEALLEIAQGARIPRDRIAFVTAYRDRNDPALKKTFGSLAWNTIVWFLAEPDHVVILRSRPALEQRRIFDLLNENS
ncbi:MAG TPA: BsuBI/PstI family type II restriction endonuclease [Thermoanaerobaculia bacterium]